MITYFIRAVSGGPLKIGRTTCLRQRLRDLQTGNPESLEVVAIMLGDWERVFHYKFIGDSLRGEWYRPSADLLSLLDDLHNEPKNAYRLRLEWQEEYHSRISQISTSHIKDLWRMRKINKDRGTNYQTATEIAKHFDIETKEIKRMFREGKIRADKLYNTRYYSLRDVSNELLRRSLE